jgi:hypothetical protein
VATSDFGLYTPDRKVFVATAEAGTSEARPDQYLDNISDDEESANAPADETTEAKNARRDQKRKRADRHLLLWEALSIRNLNEALDEIANRSHTTPEQCLMSINRIGRAVQGNRAGDLITKLAEDAYFMRVKYRILVTKLLVTAALQ